MKTAGLPLKIVRGKGCYIYDEQGNEYIDAVSSWWTNLHGHAHQHIAQAIYKQACELEHVIFAGFTHQPAETLAAKLLQHIPYHSKVFYTDNGSTAVEVAIKMALQYWWNSGVNKKRIVAFKDAYHGDTFGAMSISARGVFTTPYQPLLFDIDFIDTPVPGHEHVSTEQLRTILRKGETAAFIFEPLVLGSGGMLMYNTQVLDELIDICRQHNVITIADEVMTGFGRTGKFWATDHCKNKPDILCMSKGITGGFMPFAATTCAEYIYQAFLSTEKTKMLFHGHSYTANPLGCAAAIASLEVFDTENTFMKIAAIETQHAVFAQKLKNHKQIKNVRQWGTILAFEINTDGNTGYLSNIRDKAYNYFLERKVILRPLGNIVYVLPPYCLSANDLLTTYDTINSFIESLPEN
jgi:adenosylmethionine-8-amino-7-oxononanoate aminotransferase